MISWVLHTCVKNKHARKQDTAWETPDTNTPSRSSRRPLWACTWAQFSHSAQGPPSPARASGKCRQVRHCAGQRRVLMTQDDGLLREGIECGTCWRRARLSRGPDTAGKGLGMFFPLPPLAKPARLLSPRTRPAQKKKTHADPPMSCQAYSAPTLRPRVRHGAEEACTGRPSMILVVSVGSNLKGLHASRWRA